MNNSINNTKINTIRNIITSISEEKNTKIKLDLFIDLLKKLEDFEYNKLSKLNKKLEHAKNEIIYQYFSKCALNKFGVKINNINSLNNNKLNNIKICTKKFENINNKKLTNKLSQILQDKDEQEKNYNLINKLMELHNNIYSTFLKLRLKLFDNIPSKINLNYFDMLYIKPFKYIPNYIILWFEKYIPYYIKNLEQLIKKGYVTNNAKNKLEKEVKDLLNNLKDFKKEFLDITKSKFFEDYITNKDYGLRGLIKNINSYDKMKIYHAKANIDINIINSNIVNSKKSNKTTNITNNNSSPNTTRINLSRMKNLFEKRITNSKKNNPLLAQ